MRVCSKKKTKNRKSNTPKHTLSRNGKSFRKTLVIQSMKNITKNMKSLKRQFRNCKNTFRIMKDQQNSLVNLYRKM